MLRETSAYARRRHAGERRRQGQNRHRRGSVDVRFSFLPKEDIEISNASAGITLSLPESASFEIVADCHSGDIDSEFQADSLKLTPGSGSKDAHLEGKYGTGRGPKIV